MEIFIEDVSRREAMFAVLGSIKRKIFHIFVFCHQEIFAFAYKTKTDLPLLWLPCAPHRYNQNSHIPTSDINLAAWQTERRSSRFAVTLLETQATDCVETKIATMAVRRAVTDV